MLTTKGESTNAHEGDGTSCSSDEALVMRVERRGCISSRKVFANRETGRSVDFLRRFVAMRLQKKGWYEPCKLRGCAMSFKTWNCLSNGPKPLEML